MGYDYLKEKSRIFEEDNQKHFLETRDLANKLIRQAGAFKATAVVEHVTGDSWLTMACLDRLVEIGELAVYIPPRSWWQERIFYKGERNE